MLLMCTAVTCADLTVAAKTARASWFIFPASCFPACCLIEALLQGDSRHTHTLIIFSANQQSP